MTSAHAGANSAGRGENADVLAPEILSPRRRRRQVRELVDELDADELEELAAYLDERLRGIPDDADPSAPNARNVTSSPLGLEGSSLPRREAA